MFDRPAVDGKGPRASEARATPKKISRLVNSSPLGVRATAKRALLTAPLPSVPRQLTSQGHLSTPSFKPIPDDLRLSEERLMGDLHSRPTFLAALYQKTSFDHRLENIEHYITRRHRFVPPKFTLPHEVMPYVDPVEKHIVGKK